MLVAIIMFCVGLLLLYFGAEYLVNGSSSLALSFGIRPLIIGMTVVAFATSMPELMVSLLAVGKDSSDIAVGNIIGSNIVNIGLILGISALLVPLRVQRSFLKRELPFMLLATAVLWVLCQDQVISRIDASVLLTLLVFFIYYCLKTARLGGSNQPLPQQTVERQKSSRRRDWLYIIVGIVGLGFGADWMVGSAVFMARNFGLSELFIGTTIVALGTSLPELAASITSVAKGETDIGIGNVVGSNIFNILFVLGVTPLLNPIAVEPSLLRFELPVLMFFSVVLLPLSWHRYELGRVKGGFLLGGYVLFILALLYWK
ncbi:MAG: calcium/sodium antiporter [Desulfuromonadaceae bacterium]|nr:calcium/sodium antiporter [Desulfuromonadaceae bacterium]